MSTNLVRIARERSQATFPGPDPTHHRSRDRPPNLRPTPEPATDPRPAPAPVLQLTKRAEYGLIALIHLADRGGSVVSVREIAEHYPIPRRLLAEVVKDLARAGLVESQRGATGGYALARSADRITLGDVVVALEGAPLVTSCDTHVEGVRASCDVEPVCPIRSPLQRLREGIWRLMERTTLRSLCRSGGYVSLGTDLPHALGADLPHALRADLPHALRTDLPHALGAPDSSAAERADCASAALAQGDSAPLTSRD